MMRIKNILTAVVFIVILGGFFALNRAITPPEISQSERRPLAKMPELSLGAIKDAKFMSGFEDFAADSFALREGFRTLRARAVYNLFMQTDKSGLYYGDSGAGKLEPIKESEYRKSAAKIRKMAGALDGLNVYYSVVPDKSYYSGRKLPGFELERAEAILAEELPGLTYIDISSALKGGDFYRSDLHWDQPQIKSVADALCEKMGAPLPKQSFYPTAAGEFFGVYAGQLALPMEPDIMTYCLPENTDNDAFTARYLNQRGEIEEGPVYDLKLFNGRDPYDIFLRGS